MLVEEHENAHLVGGHLRYQYSCYLTAQGSGFVAYIASRVLKAL